MASVAPATLARRPAGEWRGSAGGAILSVPAWSVGALIILCGTFNAALAYINGNFVALGSSAVTAAQGALIAAAIAIGVLSRPEGAARWLVLLWLSALGFLLLSLLRGRVELKFLGDIIIIFTFIILGLSARPRVLVVSLLGFQAVLVLVAIWELLSPEGFGNVFHVQNYYVNTRGFDDAAFWSGHDDLFLSAQRPAGRLLFPATGFHRASSLFLEPVSLGNWTVVVLLGIAALQRHLRRWQVALLLLGNLILLIACDGRLALFTNLVLLAAWPLLPRLPRWAPVFFLLITYFGVVLADRFGLLPVDGGDTLAGRLKYGIDFLNGLSTQSLLGLHPQSGIVGADSGWSYFIVSQSLVGLIVIWLALTLHAGRGTREERRFIAGMALFLCLSLPISYSTFSIKTAAMLWVFYGFAIAKKETRPNMNNC